MPSVVVAKRESSPGSAGSQTEGERPSRPSRIPSGVRNAGFRSEVRRWLARFASRGANVATLVATLVIVGAFGSTVRTGLGTWLDVVVVVLLGMAGLAAVIAILLVARSCARRIPASTRLAMGAAVVSLSVAALSFVALGWAPVIVPIVALLVMSHALIGAAISRALAANWHKDA